MERKDRIDIFGGNVLVLFSMIFGLNQVMIKLVNIGLQPVLQAGLRSVCALVVVFVYALLRRKHLSVTDGSLRPGVITGTLFATEFIFLFLALDYTTVARTSILFYSMPVWLSIAAHFLIEEERLNGWRILGLMMAMTGVAWTLTDRELEGDDGSLLGDTLCIIASMCWACISIF